VGRNVPVGLLVVGLELGLELLGSEDGRADDGLELLGLDEEGLLEGFEDDGILVGDDELGRELDGVEELGDSVGALLVG